MNQTTRAAHLPHIDGLRAVAVLVILLFHLDITVFKGGFVGVDVFFVISGYLITGIITRDMATGRFSIADFYARRIKRIFPALFVMMGLTSIAAITMLAPNDYAAFFKTLRMASLEISNIHFARATDYFDLTSKNNPLLHTWSLGVEEQFYIIWPLLLLAIHKTCGLKRSIVALTLLLLASLGVSEFLTRTDQMAAFYLLQSRAWELSLGGLIALGAFPAVKTRNQAECLSGLGLIMIAASALLINETQFPGLMALPPCLGAALLLHALQQDSLTRRALSIRPLVFTGLISYSLYLWHWPLIAFYKGYFATPLTPMSQLALGVGAIVMAILSYYCVEQPIRTRNFRTRHVIAAGLGIMLVFIVGSNLLKGSYHALWRVSIKMDPVIMRPNNLFDTCATEGGAMNTEQCIIGPHKDRYEVILVGDSHAAHYIPTVLEWAKPRGLTVRIFLRGACQTWLETDAVKMVQGKVDGSCTKLTTDFYKTMETDKNIKIVFMTLFNAQMSDDLKASLEKIKSYGKINYYLGDVPIFPEDPGECRMKNNVLLSKYIPRAHEDCETIDWEYSNNTLQNSHTQLLPLLKRMGTAYYDPLPFMKTPYDAQGRFMFMDHHHLNQYGGEYLAPSLDKFTRSHGGL